MTRKLANYEHTHTKNEIVDFNHTHDDRYYTESEIDSKLGGKANTSGTYSDLNVGYASNAGNITWENVSGKPSSYTPNSHTHDDRYYTESEINSKLSGIVKLNFFLQQVLLVMDDIIRILLTVH